MIPKILHHVWVGPKPAPMHWINTWREKHPNWEHILWDNKKVQATKWINQHQIDIYWRWARRNREGWAGVADLIRYETLNKYGGFNPGADSICHHNIDELMEDPSYDLFSVYESETQRPGLISPVHASTPDNVYLKQIIKEMGQLKHPLGKPWKTTGNLYMGNFFAKQEPGRFRIFPSYYFIPNHYTGLDNYKGDGKVYAEHLWGTTKWLI